MLKSIWLDTPPIKGFLVEWRVSGGIRVRSIVRTSEESQSQSSCQCYQGFYPILS